MEKIKFRCWDKVHNKMRGVKDIKWFNNGNIRVNVAENDKYYEPLMYMKEYEGKELKEFELMQYTGLEDKNDKEIYEGDIFKESNSIGIIIYDKDGFRIKWHKDEDFYNNVLKIHHNHLEVIGNVYESPSLLEDVK